MLKDDLLNYIRGSVDMDEVELAKRMQLYANERRMICPANITFFDKLNDLCEEWASDNELPEGCWQEFGQVEDILFEI